MRSRAARPCSATTPTWDTHHQRTIANLEALFRARELHPDKGIAYSTEAHYTHGRMCGVLVVDGHPVPVDDSGALDLEALKPAEDGTGGHRGAHRGHHRARRGRTVPRVMEMRDRTTCGSTSTRLRRILRPAGGGGRPRRAARGSVAPSPRCDSIVIDPHKQRSLSLRVRCRAVPRPLGRPSVYLHDSPYTYFTSEELHLGEISLECSRAGAAAAALWLTFQVLPPTLEGLAVARAGRRAALRWAELIDRSDFLKLYQPPELDIVRILPGHLAQQPSRTSTRPPPVSPRGHGGSRGPGLREYAPDRCRSLTTRHPEITADADGARILRSVLMKPESEQYVDRCTPPGAARPFVTNSAATRTRAARAVTRDGNGRRGRDVSPAAAGRAVEAPRCNAECKNQVKGPDARWNSTSLRGSSRRSRSCRHRPGKVGAPHAVAEQDPRAASQALRTRAYNRVQQIAAQNAAVNEMLTRQDIVLLIQVEPGVGDPGHRGHHCGTAAAPGSPSPSTSTRATTPTS